MLGEKLEVEGKIPGINNQAALFTKPERESDNKIPHTTGFITTHEFNGLNKKF